MSLIETRDSVEIKPLALFTAGTAAGVSSESCAEPEYLRPCETQFFVFFSSSLQTRPAFSLVVCSALRVAVLDLWFLRNLVRLL